MAYNELNVKGDVIKLCRQKEKSEFSLGGILRRGSWAWLVEDNTLQIVALKNGQIISSHTFSPNVYNCSVIVCVEEVIPDVSSHDVLLAVCLDDKQNGGTKEIARSSIAIYSVEYGRVLSCLSLRTKITAICFLRPEICCRSIFKYFDGCLAVGTEEGETFLIDLYLKYLLDLFAEDQKHYFISEITPTNCQIVDFTYSANEIKRAYKNVLRERSVQSCQHFGIQLEIIESPCRVETFLPIDLITGLAVGFENGRLLMYNLEKMEIFYASEDHEHIPLIKMDFLQPIDNPQACFYILSLHGNGDEVVMSIFTFKYQKRVTDNCDIFFENFQYGTKTMTILLDDSPPSTIIKCQAITKKAKNSYDDDATCLFAISWNSVANEEIKLLVFDINQWYKHLMPRKLSVEQAKSVLATFKLKHIKNGLDAFLNPATISHFNSMQRPDEHFYPNSLSFDWVILNKDTCRVCNWPGIQNKTLNILRASKASLFLEPDDMFEQIRKTHLMPQFMEMNINALFSKEAKYEVILSVALEHNCMGLLRNCARSWADGSFMGNNCIAPVSGTELSSQLLKRWIRKRALQFKMRFNKLYEKILNPTAHILDPREKKELGFITRQLRSLDELLNQVSKYCGEEVIDNSLHLTADYQELLIWVINIGLLPDIRREPLKDDVASTSSFVPKTSPIYPYEQLRDYYIQRRLQFAQLNESYTSKKSGSCRLLFIDAFIEHECMREFWIQNSGNGLYPPTDIKAMVSIMLTKIQYDSKCVILFYLLLDMHIALQEVEDLKHIIDNLLKFPKVFNMPPSLTKTVQAFWHLDHGDVVAAVDELLSTFNTNRKLEQWLVELMVESLLLQNAAHLALRVLKAYSHLIAPSLQLSTLLMRNSIDDAFHFVRTENDAELMKRFFMNCLRMGKLGVIRDLALNENEEKLIENLLKTIEFPGAKNLYFVYLLQNSKYIEAVSYMNELSKERNCYRNAEGNTMDTPNLVLSAFNTTMTPLKERLTEIYFRVRNKITPKESQNYSRVPFSSQLIQQNSTDSLEDIYHHIIMNTYLASMDSDEQLRCGQRNSNASCQAELSPLSANNAPFLRKVQPKMREVLDMPNRRTLSYPREYKPPDKRRINEVQQDAVDAFGGENIQQREMQQSNKKRRLLDEDFLMGFKHFQQSNVVLNNTSLSTLKIHSTISSTSVAVKDSGISMATKNLDAQDPTDSLYQSARSESPSPNAIGHKPRKQILRTSAEPEQVPREEQHIIQKHDLSFNNPDTDAKETSSGLGTSKESSNLRSTIPFMFKISPVTTLSTAEFSPKVCSSKVGETQAKLLTEQSKIAERSTLITTSDSTRPLDAQDTTNSLYQTARCKSLSPNVVGPKPRKPLLRMSAEPEQLPRKEQQILQKNDFSLNNPDTHAKETSSGLGRSKESSNLRTTIPSLLKISSVTTLLSTEFSPKVCSSKVGDTQTKLLTEQSKIAERSTVIMTSGSICDIDLQPSIQSESKNVFIEPKPPLMSTEESKNDNIEKSAAPSLDTTLGMSSYEMADFETTALETVCEEKSNDELELLERESDTILSTQDEVHDSDESENSEEVIELLSSSDEVEVEMSDDDNESVGEYESDEQSSNSEVETNDTDSNQESYNSNETDPEVNIDVDDESDMSDSNDIVLQQEESEISDDEDSNRTNTLIEIDNSRNSTTDGLEEKSETQRLDPIQTDLQSQKNQETDSTPTVDPATDKELNLQDKEPNILPDSALILSESINESPDNSKEKQDPIPDRNVEQNPIESIKKSDDSLLPIEQAEKEINTSEDISNIVCTIHDKGELNEVVSETKDGSLLPVEHPENETNTPEDISNTVCTIHDKGELTEVHPETTRNDSVPPVEHPENKTNIPEDIPNTIFTHSKEKLTEVLSETEDGSLLPVEHPENETNAPEDISNTVCTIHDKGELTEVHPETTRNDSVPPVEHPENETNILEDISSTVPTNSSQKSRRRGQSMPPQPLLINEENIETDCRTPKSRSKRGISVPPQTVDTVALTPTNIPRRPARNMLLSGRSITIHEEGDSPQSPSRRPQLDSPALHTRSRRRTTSETSNVTATSLNSPAVSANRIDSPQSPTSSRGSKRRRSMWDSGGTPQLDSPALHTRSRKRTISENSDATATSLNSPAVSANRVRRTSISSAISEQWQHSQTPKRTRRTSSSGQSNTEGTSRTRRLLVKEQEEEEANEADKSELPTTSTGIDLFSSSRRLTRTQRALLEKSQQIASMRDIIKDDQASVSSRISQTSTRSKRQTSRSASVKSNDDHDDDRSSVTSSVASETRRSRRLLRTQQLNSPNVQLSVIPEDEVDQDTAPPPKSTKSVKK